MWLRHRTTQVAVSYLPKNASTSLSLLFDSDGIYTSDAIMELSEKRVAWIRHPIDRLISAYSFFLSSYELGHLHTASILGVPEDLNPSVDLSSWKAFVEFILNNPNEHWNPQVPQLTTSEGVWVPTHTHRFEDLDLLWGNYFDTPLGRENEGSLVPVDPEVREEELNCYYLADLECWEGITQ